MEKEPIKSDSINGFKLLAVLAVIGFAALIFWPSSPNPDSLGYKGEAEIACERKVEAQLKAPRSAKFSQQQAVQTSRGKWSVTGVVDAENSFGTMIRHSYSCQLTASEDHSYHGTAVLR